MKNLIIALLLLIPMSLFSQAKYNKINTNQIDSRSTGNVEFLSPIKHMDGSTQSTAYDSSKVAQQIEDSIKNISLVETDPVFNASPSHGISSINIMNWNNKIGTDLESPVTEIAQYDVDYWNAKEPPLGNPAIDGYILSSTTGGVRSWIATSTPIDDILDWSTNKYTLFSTRQSTATLYGQNTINPNGSDTAKFNGIFKATNIYIDKNNQIYSDRFFPPLTGNNNTALGKLTFNTAMSASGNTAIGSRNLETISSGANNTAVGYYSMNALGIGSGNTAIGMQSLSSTSTTSYNVAVGFNSLVANTAANNTAIGAYSANGNTSASGTTALGHKALYTNSTGNNNTAVGYLSSYYITGAANTSIGTSSLYSGTSCIGNTALGSQALFSVTANTNNTGVGASSAYYNTGGNNTAVGFESLYGSTGVSSGGYNVAVGCSTLRNLTTGTYNTAIGQFSHQNITTGINNTALGAYGLNNSTSASRCIAIGFSAGYYNTLNNRFYVNVFDQGSLANDSMKSLIAGYFDPDPTKQRLRFNSSTILGCDANFTSFSSDGTLTLNGTATVFDELQFDLFSLKSVGTTAKPDEDLTNLCYLFPQNDTTEMMGKSEEFPHWYKAGSSGNFMVHIDQTVNATPVFGIAYKVYNVGSAEPASWTVIYSNGLTNTYTSGTIGNIVTFPAISLTGITLGATIKVKLYRKDNVYTGDCRVTRFGLHLEKDRLGSSTEYSN